MLFAPARRRAFVTERRSRSGGSRTRIRRLGPLRQHTEHFWLNHRAGPEPVDALHEQGVVGGVLVANPGDDGQVDGFGFEGATGGGAANASAAAQGGVTGDAVRLLGRAARVASLDGL